ncbi:MAG TPA: MM0924 family protein [Pyrinomonadaceae bacterium]|nr:MM0924 family protein [Pyrinomonadaceae bacterium]
MEELLKSLMGKKVDISCGASAAFRGDVVDVKDGVLYLRDEDEKVAYVAIEKIALISEVKENLNRPGFLG